MPIPSYPRCRHRVLVSVCARACVCVRVREGERESVCVCVCVDTSTPVTSITCEVGLGWVSYSVLRCASWVLLLLCECGTQIKPQIRRCTHTHTHTPSTSREVSVGAQHNYCTISHTHTHTHTRTHAHYTNTRHFRPALHTRGEYSITSQQDLPLRSAGTSNDSTATATPSVFSPLLSGSVTLVVVQTIKRNPTQILSKEVTKSNPTLQ
jgi:hypothetical protein